MPFSLSQKIYVLAKIQNTDKNVIENTEQQELSFTANKCAKWHSHSERQFGSFLQN